MKIPHEKPKKLPGIGLSLDLFFVNSTIIWASPWSLTRGGIGYNGNVVLAD